MNECLGVGNEMKSIRFREGIHSLGKTNVNDNFILNLKGARISFYSFTPENFPHAGLEENYCRNPDRNENGPWCFTTDPATRLDYCSIPECEVLQFEGMFLLIARGLDKNYCRNPDGKKRPWCYTTDNTTRWQYCSIPPCPQIASQITGKKCQAWNSVLPHRHNRTANNFPKADLRENYCRNPDNDIAPWYYTTVPTVRWEYCNLQKCDCGGHLASPEPPYSTLDPGTNMTGSNITECIIGNGKDYRGAVTKTRSNRTCQGWSSQEPHHHSYLTPE
ncbi:plasminogen-like [Struthio camelus]|uniref:plasminogen-like n=1 Tax=Struthio camelus TaxID=8801 RepID=UPI003603B5FC